MTGLTWKTGPPPPRRQRLARPAPSQVLRQLAVVALICVTWAIVFAGYLRLTDESTDSAPPAIALATHSPAPSPPSTATPLAPTVTPTLTDEPPTPTATTVGTSTPKPSPLPGETPQPTPTATPTLPPPTDTPAPTPTTTTPPPTETPSPQPDGAEVSFSGDVLPIFQNRCVKCHGGERTEEGLILKTYADVMAGSFNGPVVVPGDASDSYIVEQVGSGKMPKRAPRLLPGEIRFITEWVNAGAPDN